MKSFENYSRLGTNFGMNRVGYAVRAVQTRGQFVTAKFQMTDSNAEIVSYRKGWLSVGPDIHQDKNLPFFSKNYFSLIPNTPTYLGGQCEPTSFLRLKSLIIFVT